MTDALSKELYGENPSMDKISDKIKSLDEATDFISLEFFPPKTQTGFTNLQARLERVTRDLNPLFVAITWGAGGSTATRSLELAEYCQSRLGLTTCLHLTCTNAPRASIDQALREAKAVGIRNILAIRGDAPRFQEHHAVEEKSSVLSRSTSTFTYAIDLVRYIRQSFGDYFCIGVAAYPEGHCDTSYPGSRGIQQDLAHLVAKIEAGADFVLTQLFYNPDDFCTLENLLREELSDSYKKIPIIPGLLPVQSYSILQRSIKLTHASLPIETAIKIEAVKGNDDEVKAIGVDYMVDIIGQLKRRSPPKGRGYHFFTLNLEKVVRDIISRCGLSRQHSASNHIVQHLTHDIIPPQILGTTNTELVQKARLLSLSEEGAPSTTQSFSITTSREMDWDDYPNGRFGDSRSAAFDPPVSYSFDSFQFTKAECVSLWGNPKCHNDISRLVLSHLSGNHPDRLPWSDSASISRETALIYPQLTKLIEEQRFWTVASQPAVDGVVSTDSIHGWGPSDGFVFQKAFIEFFVPLQDFQRHLKKPLQALSSLGEVSYYAFTPALFWETSEDADSMNAVTWGCFKGKEIATVTMVDETSFRTWAEDAFNIWTSWAACADGTVHDGKLGSKQVEDSKASAAYLAQLRSDLVLVNVISHMYKTPMHLWDTLLACRSQSQSHFPKD